MSQTPASLSESEFLAMFGGIYEHSPWVAQRVWQSGLGNEANSLDGLAQTFAKTFLDATHDEQLQVILAHPDLAGKAAVRGELTEESSNEQAGAGIDQCSAEELAQFEQYNNRYKAQFNFPFIMAVKGSNRYEILKSFEVRLNNDSQAEFKTALQEINKIARFRLEAIFQS